MLKGISPLLSPELLKILNEMGHGDELLHPLADGLAPELCHAVLRHHHVHDVPGDRHHVARGEPGDDPGDGSALGGGLEGDDAPAVLRVEGPVGEVPGPAGDEVRVPALERPAGEGRGRAGLGRGGVLVDRLGGGRRALLVRERDRDGGGRLEVDRGGSGLADADEVVLDCDIEVRIDDKPALESPEVTHRYTFGSPDKCGEKSEKLYRKIIGIQKGLEPDTRGWCLFIEE